MNSPKRSRWWRLWVLGLIAVTAAASLHLAACTPNSGITVQESDVVATVYDKDVNFGAIKTFAMPDTIIHMEGADSTLLTREADEEILALVAANFEARGYERVFEGAPNPPDVAVLCQATAGSYYSLYSSYPWYGWGGYYPGWGWGGGWGWYYPPSWGVSYSYSLGTLIVTMGDPDEISDDPETPTVPAYWTGTINGILDDKTSSLRSRVGNAINQMFEQSPYLRSSVE